jgi:pimeloyl-ACP methyl ester carboxylesterase
LRSGAVGIAGAGHRPTLQAAFVDPAKFRAGKRDQYRHRMAMPAGLWVLDQEPQSTPTSGPGVPVAILVHGSLDRAESFRRVMRRLPDVRVVAYDRRGYQHSRGSGVVGLEGHIADLVEIASALQGDGPVVSVGHSLGGDVVIGAALARPDLFASIGAYEPPMPWLGYRRSGAGSSWPPMSEDPGEEAERFFRRMVGEEAWDRLSPEARADRLADGPALVGDLVSLRGPQIFDVEELRVPSVFGRGGDGSAPHHRDSVLWLSEHIPGAELFEIPGATHGAHLSHPDAFSQLVRRVLALGTSRP